MNLAQRLRARHKATREQQAVIFEDGERDLDLEAADTLERWNTHIGILAGTISDLTQKIAARKRGQTWWGSIVEAKANIAVGFFVAMAANAVVLPLFGYPVTAADNLGITCVFTVISVVRQLIVRRFFNGLKWGHHK